MSGYGLIVGYKVAIAVMDFSFLAATLGSVVGERITLADISVASGFANLSHMGCDRDTGRHGRLYAYVDSILARPRFAQWIERETAMFSKHAA